MTAHPDHDADKSIEVSSDAPATLAEFLCRCPTPTTRMQPVADDETDPTTTTVARAIGSYNAVDGSPTSQESVASHALTLDGMRGSSTSPQSAVILSSASTCRVAADLT